ncbi:MAG: Gfo/Idh/MocA family protein [Planctomycetota bacterium]|jgi:predicted dehydrogenase
MSRRQHLTRRGFLKKTTGLALGTIAFPYVVPSSALGKAGTVAPSNRITAGMVGWGMQGPGNTAAFLSEKDCQVVAMCDLDEGPLEDAVQTINKRNDNQDCKPYHDFREMFARKDIDMVMLAVPDHWHAILAIAAAKAGKDIFGEKPLAHSYAEQQAICRAVKQYGRVWQTGSWQRSQRNFRFACELVRNGYIGEIKEVHVGLPSGHNDFSGRASETTFTDPPKELDYNFWLGPAPYAPYCPARVHMNWRWNMDYGGGQLLDWIGHHLDIAHWGLDFDSTGPVEVEAQGDFPTEGIYNSPTRYRVYTKYANGIKITMAGGHRDIRSGTKWFGDDGWIHVDRGFLDASNKKLLNETIKPSQINLFRSPGHQRNFLDCIKSRAKTLTPVETAHRSAAPGHLAYISMYLGRKIDFDPDKEQILNDPRASQLMAAAPMRSPWHL